MTGFFWKYSQGPEILNVPGRTEISAKFFYKSMPMTEKQVIRWSLSLIIGERQVKVRGEESHTCWCDYSKKLECEWNRRDLWITERTVSREWLLFLGTHKKAREHGGRRLAPYKAQWTQVEMTNTPLTLGPGIGIGGGQASALGHSLAFTFLLLCHT